MEGEKTMVIIQSFLNALFMAFSMLWEILWPLILGFTLSGIIQAVVSHQALAKTLGGNGLKSLTFATLFGIASSSCSYAAVALARSIFQKGASFTAAMVFEIASTNLVIELGIILIVRFTLTPRLVALAHEQARKGLVGRMEGHAGMDMSVQGGPFLSRLFSG